MFSPEVTGHFPIPPPSVAEISDSGFPFVSMNNQGVIMKQVLSADTFVHGQNLLHVELVSTEAKALSRTIFNGPVMVRQ